MDGPMCFGRAISRWDDVQYKVGPGSSYKWHLYSPISIGWNFYKEPIAASIYNDRPGIHLAASRCCGKRGMSMVRRPGSRGFTPVGQVFFVNEQNPGSFGGSTKSSENFGRNSWQNCCFFKVFLQCAEFNLDVETMRQDVSWFLADFWGSHYKTIVDARHLGCY